jgi:ABC-type phosphonate transport system ATPase subunit
MNSRTTRRFRALLAALPEHVRRQAREAYRIFHQNPAHPGLRFKLVHADPPIYSARLGIGHRAVGALDGDTVIWYWIGSHAEYDKLLAQL